MELLVNNRTALVTGCAKRIGRDIVLDLARSKINIAIHYNFSRAEALELKAQIQEIGVEAEIFQADLNEDCYEKLIKDVVKRFPNLDILINNASIFEKTPILETTKDQLDRHLNINFQAPFFLTQHFAKIQKKGVIINFLDAKVKKTSKNYFSYILTKKILADFTSMAAIELGPNIRINAICPGITEISPGFDENDFKRIANSLPLKKITKIQELTEAVNILINNDFFTGQSLFIDSGESL